MMNCYTFSLCAIRFINMRQRQRLKILNYRSSPLVSIQLSPLNKILSFNIAVAFAKSVQLVVDQEVVYTILKFYLQIVCLAFAERNIHIVIKIHHTEYIHITRLYLICF